MLKQFQVIKHISSGFQADLYLVKTPQNELLVAKKYRGTDQLEYFKNEAFVLNQLDHPNIVSLKHVQQNWCHCQNGKMEVSPTLFLQYIDGIQLFTLIDKISSLDQVLVRAIFLQVIQGVSVIHQQLFVHRDLKQQNIMIHRDGRVKIVDFGFSCKKEGENGTVKARPAGTQGYYSYQATNSQFNGQKADMFSLGVILFQMIFGLQPFTSVNQKDYYYRWIMKAQWQLFWKSWENKLKRSVSEVLKDLLSRMLSHRPEDRPSIKELLEQQWLKGPCASKQVLIQVLKGVFDQ